MSVVKNTLFLTLSLVISKVLSFIYFAVVARYLGVEVTGAYIFALSLTTLCAIISDFGLTPFITRVVSAEQGSPRIFGGAILTKILLIVASVAVVSGVTAFSSYEVAILRLLPFAMLVMVLDAVQVFLYGVLRGLQLLSYESIGMVSGQMLSLVFGVVGLLSGFDEVWLIIGLSLGSLLQVVLSWVIVARKRVFVSVAFPSSHDMRLIGAGSIAFGLAGLFSRGYSQIDMVLLQHFTSLAVVGVYAVASKIVFSLQFIPIALSASLFPALSKVSHDTVASQKLLKGGFHYLMIICVPLSLCMIVFAQPILQFAFGVNYLLATIPLQILAVSLLFGFLDYPLGAYLNGSGKAKLQTMSMGITLGVNIMCNVLLIPYLGAVGAAISALIAQCVLFFCGYYFSRFVLKEIVPELFLQFLKILFVSALSLSVSYIGLHVTGITVVSFLAFLALFGILYLVLLSVLRVFSVPEFLKALR